MLKYLKRETIGIKSFESTHMFVSKYLEQSQAIFRKGKVASPCHTTKIFVFFSHVIFKKTWKFFIKPAGRLRGAQPFDELRRYHTRPLQLNWGPENVHFGKRI